MNWSEFNTLGLTDEPFGLIADGGAMLVTRGSEGATVYLKEGQPLQSTAVNRCPISAVGAGDVFSAGLIAGYLKSRDWKVSLELANCAVALFLDRTRPAKFPFRITTEQICRA